MSVEMESIQDLSAKYKISEKNLKKIIEENKILHAASDGQILVNTRAFDTWMASNIKYMSSEKLAELETDEKKGITLIYPMLVESRVIFNPPDLTKTQVLTRLVDSLAESGAVAKKNLKYVFKAVVERERLCSTAIMDGVAIPHPRSSMEKYVTEPTLVLAISKRGIHFESEDGKPTNLFFLICANSIDVHLKVMARLSRLLRSPKFRHELIISENFDKAREVFMDWEKRI